MVSECLRWCHCVNCVCARAVLLNIHYQDEAATYVGDGRADDGCRSRGHLQWSLRVVVVVSGGLIIVLLGGERGWHHV